MGNPLIPNSPTLLIKEINDTYLRQNFKNLDAYFQANNQLLGFKFFEQIFTKAQSNLKIAHGLSITPLDIITTQVTGPGEVTFNYGLFDKSNLDVSATDKCRVRFFAGTYFNFQSSANANTTDQQSFGGSNSAASNTISAVGDFKLSGLGETDFQAAYGSDWVLCDGRAVSGSTYSTQISPTVPNIPSVAIANPQHAEAQIGGAQNIGITSSYYTPAPSPALKFTPKISGLYRVWLAAPMLFTGGAPIVGTRIIDSTGQVTPINESSYLWYPNVQQTFSGILTQCQFNLLAGKTYQFDYQIFSQGSGSFETGNDWNNATMYVEQVNQTLGINAYVRIN